MARSPIATIAEGARSPSTDKPAGYSGEPRSTWMGETSAMAPDYTREAMQLHLTDEQRMLIHTVRRCGQEEILPLERELDPDAYELPREQHERLVAMTKAMGLYQMALPKEYGGQEVDVITRVLLTEEMAQHRAGLYHPCYDVF